MTAIRDAIVVPGPGDAERRVAGVPLLLRTILTLQRAGIERVTVVGAVPPADPRIRCTVITAATLAPAADAAPRLVIGHGTVVDDALIHALQGRAEAGDTLHLAVDGARLDVVPGHRLLAADGPSEPPPAGTLAPATMPAGRLAHQLLRGLENPRDGYLDRLINRHVSRPLTRLLLHTSLTPNAVTVIGIVLGVLGGGLLASPSAVATTTAIASLFVSGVLDCCDGELARLRFSESKIGHLLDVTGDTLVHLAFFGGITRRLMLTGGLPDPSILVVLLAGVLGAFAVISWSEATEARRRRVTCWENTVLANVLSPLTTRDWYVFPLAFALAGRLDALVPAAAYGAHGFWLVTLFVLRRALHRTRAAS